jgi:hypothetical protein
LSRSGQASAASELAPDMNSQDSVYETLDKCHDYEKETRWYAVSYYELSMSDEMMMIYVI